MPSKLAQRIVQSFEGGPADRALGRILGNTYEFAAKGALKTGLWTAKKYVRLTIVWPECSTNLVKHGFFGLKLDAFEKVIRKDIAYREKADHLCEKIEHNNRWVQDRLQPLIN